MCPIKGGSVWLAACFLSVNAWAAGPALTVGKASGRAGTVTEIPVTFNPGNASVSGIQFNLTLPPAASLASVSTGDSVTASGKSLESNRKGNRWTFIIYGLNQNLQRAGTILLAKVKLTSQAAAGTFKVPISNVVFTDPKGSTIRAGATHPGALTINKTPT